MDPVTLSVAAAALIATFVGNFAAEAGKTAGTHTADAGALAVGKLVDWLRNRFSSDNDAAGAAALAQVENVPDSPKLQNLLAEAIAVKAQNDPSFKAELETLVSQARDAGANVSAVAQTAVGNQNVQNANIKGSTITVSQGPPPAGPVPPVSSLVAGSAGD